MPEEEEDEEVACIWSEKAGKVEERKKRKQKATKDAEVDGDVMQKRKEGGEEEEEEKCLCEREREGEIVQKRPLTKGTGRRARKRKDSKKKHLQNRRIHMNIVEK